MHRWSLVLVSLTWLLAGCGQPDTRALQKLACEQASANLDMQSVGQLDALRKALGVAPDVDPIAQCRALGARMEAAPTAGEGAKSPQGGNRSEN